MAFWIFQNVVITAALAAAVALVCRSGRIGPVARHALWLIVLIKFVTPPLVVWPWAAPDPFGISAIDAIDARARVDEAAAMRVSLLDSSRPAASDGAVLMSTNLVPDDRAVAGGDDATAWTMWALMVWVAGSVVLLGIEVVRLVRLARRIRRGAAASGDSAIARRVAALSARLGIRPVAVVIVPGTSSPVVWGLGRPMLLWPADLPAGSTEACVDGLLVHELAHVKRRDHLIGWIELLAGVTWWWNPLFWFVRSARREQAELACDAWVISALPNGRRAYAESLLALSGAAAGGASSMSSSLPTAAVGIHATSRRVLERRLVMIMKGRAPLRLPFAGIFCLALIGAATLPAWATSAQNPPQPQSAPPATPVVAAPTAPAPPAPAQTQSTRPVPASRARAAVGVPGGVPGGVPVGVVTAVPVGVPGGVPVGVVTAVPVGVPGGVPVGVVTSVPVRVGGVVTSVPVATQQTAPLPPPPPAARQTAPPPPPPPPAQSRKVEKVAPVVKTPSTNWTVKTFTPANLPEDGKQLVDSFDKDRVAIEAEVEQKVAARREAAVKALQTLQEQYTKAGKLDEAIAIRDYLRAGGPGNGRFLLWKSGK